MLIAPDHYDEKEFSKLPRKINEKPIVWGGLKFMELLVIGGVFLAGIILTMIVGSGNLTMIILISVLVISICGVLILAFRHSHSLAKRCYWHHVKFVLDQLNEPLRWTGDAYAYAWGVDREGKPVKGDGYRRVGGGKTKKKK